MRQRPKVAHVVMAAYLDSPHTRRAYGRLLTDAMTVLLAKVRTDRDRLATVVQAQAEQFATAGQERAAEGSASADRAVR